MASASASLEAILTPSLGLNSGTLTLLSMVTMASLSWFLEIP